MRVRMLRNAIFPVISYLFLFTFSTEPVHASDVQPAGFRALPPGVHALTGGQVVVKPGETIDGGTIIIRDGLIRAVGKDAAIPADARVWDLKGATIYAGFIDPYLVLSASNAPLATTDIEPISSSSFTASGIKFFGAPGAQTDMGNPGPGYELTKVTPEFRAVRDYSPKEKTLEPLRELGFTAGVLIPSKGIVRGTSALVALTEDDPNNVVIKPDVFQHVGFESGERGEGYPGSLMGAIAVVRQSFADAHHYVLDQADYAKHAHDRKRPAFDPAREALGPAAEKKMTVVFEPGSALMSSRSWHLGAELGLDFCIVSSGQEWRRPDLVKQAGVPFIVPLNFPTLPKLPSDDDWEQVSLDQLRAWDWAAENAAVLRKDGQEIALTTYGLKDKKKFRQNLRQAIDRGLSETDALAALTTVPAKLCGVDAMMGSIEPGKLANLTVVTGKSYFDPESKLREVWIDGRIYRLPAEEPKDKGEKGDKPDKSEKTAETAKAATPPEGEAAKDKEKDKEKNGKKKEEIRELQKTRVARAPLDGRGPLASPESLLITNATIWTCSANGTLKGANLLVSGGKIKAVGTFRPEPGANTLVMNGEGLNVSPGIIDCHNHSVILGSVNEGTLPSSAMVRIRDVVNSETEHIYEHLAGGVTAANLLHGSANPIGGQNCVIKLRDGVGPDELVFEAAPPGIKFALGENVKQSNWGERATTRFPQTRMGVRTFIANRFTAARHYLAEWDKFKQSGGLPPARNLELEALGEVLQGKRLIHCHSYRQDEILAFLRTMEGFGVKVGSLQHVLEGYKIADEIAQHGAGASTFSDWWAYKFEVYDAIPFNGSLMNERGVVVSFNSDSSDLARRLYVEAAKAVKYGEASQEDALKFVTLNPAKQLHIDQLVGSIEPGKDADLAIWSREPLDSETACVQTWVDGKKYFDRDMAQARATRLSEERTALIEKAKKLMKLAGGGGGGEDKGGDDGSFFAVSLEHQFDGMDRHCMEEEE